MIGLMLIVVMLMSYSGVVSLVLVLWRIGPTFRQDHGI